MKLILKESNRFNVKKPMDSNVNVGSSIQEKNITFPNDAKLLKNEGIEILQSQSMTLKS